jgi:hypothetical protein
MINNQLSFYIYTLLAETQMETVDKFGAKKTYWMDMYLHLV